MGGSAATGSHGPTGPVRARPRAWATGLNPPATLAVRDHRRPRSIVKLGPQDVLMYIKSEETIRLVLPPDCHDEALRGLRSQGFYSVAPGPSYAFHVGTSSDVGNFGNKPILDKEIPEAETEALRRTWAAVYAKHKTLHVVDVGKESALRRVIEEHRHRLQEFPVLVRPDGRRLEGTKNFSDENLAKFLSD
jgi:hypothetical protein